ncbi:MAG TPA: DUF423 domain-containing protein [Trueperaceae bacterium]
MTPRTAAATGALWAALAVAAGAFGAHGLEGLVSGDLLGTFETAVRYQMFHALGLLAAAAIGPRACRAAPWLLAGSLVFSGSLYLLVAGAPNWFGAVAPVGGLLMIWGWVYLAILGLRGE